MKLSCIIVDDEEEAREGLLLLLQQDHDIEVVAICSNGIEAIKDINALKPDLVLLDIQMPEVNGFEVLNSLDHQPPAVIFITAYDQFALKAFEVHAIDYLLKPFSDDRFFEAIAHAKQVVKNQSPDERIAQEVKSIIQGQKVQNEMLHSNEQGRLVFKADGRIHFLDFQDIMWVEAYDYYVKIHTDQRFYLVRESMKNMLNKLDDTFARIHKSSIININYIEFLDRLPKNNEYHVVLQNGLELKVSRTYADSLIQKIS